MALIHLSKSNFSVPSPVKNIKGDYYFVDTLQGKYCIIGRSENRKKIFLLCNSNNKLLSDLKTPHAKNQLH